MRAPPENGRGFREAMPDVFAALFGAFLGLSLLKFVNPPILDRLVSEPTNFREWLVFAWPLKWGHWLLAVVGIVGLLAARIKRNSPWLVAALPGAWFI
ncbi:MAG TPA: hypothetical protein VFC07_13860, partial [Verrucomicrobiae bacterium]|nr:hypothetical protein [Verrucomicrobiae bacterium]